MQYMFLFLAFFALITISRIKKPQEENTLRERLKVQIHDQVGRSHEGQRRSPEEEKVIPQPLLNKYICPRPKKRPPFFI
jgi:hypothetical protein